MLLLTWSGWCFFSLFLSTVSADLRPRPLFLFGGGRVHAAEPKFWDHQKAGVSKPTGSGSLHVSLCKGQFPGDLWPWDTLLHPLWRLTFIFWFFHNNWFFLFSVVKWGQSWNFSFSPHRPSTKFFYSMQRSYPRTSPLTWTRRTWWVSARRLHELVTNW